MHAGVAHTELTVDEMLTAQLKLLDDFKFDEAELLLARIKSKALASDPPKLLARVKSAEAALVFARAAAHMATKSEPEDASMFVEVTAGQDALRLALEACDMAATAPSTDAIESLELLLIQLSSILTAVQAATALEAASLGEDSRAAPLFTRALQLCRKYTSEFAAAQLDFVRWDDPWTPFVKLLFYRAIEAQNATPSLDSEFTATVIEAKKAALGAIAAGAQSQELALLDLHIMHCFVLQRTLILAARPQPALADQLRAVVGEGLAQISSSAARDQPAYLKAKNELKEFLEVVSY
jgi:hypothetical protein